MGARIPTLAAAITVAFFAGVTVSFFTLPLWVAFAINIAKEGSRADWFGFVGALLAGGLTAAFTVLSVAVSAYVIKQQISIGLFSREEDRIESMLPGLMEAQQYAVTVAIHARRIRGILETDLEGDGMMLFDLYGALKALSNAASALPSKTPNSTDAMRRYLATIFDHIEGRATSATNAHGLVRTAINNVAMAKNIAPQLAMEKRNLEKRQGEFRIQAQLFAQAVDSAEGYVRDLGVRIDTLENRLRIYRAEIEQLLPTKRD